MNRIALLVLLLASLVACKRGNDAAVPSEEAASDEPESAAEERPKIDGKTVDAWIAERREHHAAFDTHVKKIEALRKSDPDSVVKMTKLWADFDAETQRIEKKHGLTHQQRKAIDDMAAEAAVNALGAGDDAVKAMRDAQKELDSLPEDQRAEAKAALEANEKQLLDERNLTAQRKTWGDAAADAVIAKREEITALWKEWIEMEQKRGAR